MAVVMVIEPIAVGDVPAMHGLVERCCRMLAAHPDWGSLRVVLRNGFVASQAQEAVETARVHHLRCWVAKREIVLEVPDDTGPSWLDMGANDDLTSRVAPGGDSPR